MTREEFLKKYMTVVDSAEAIQDNDTDFINKYLTQVGCPEEGATGDTGTTGDTGSTGDTGTTGNTGSNPS